MWALLIAAAPGIVGLQPLYAGALVGYAISLIGEMTGF